MEFPSFSSIDSQDISRISHYAYKYLDRYLSMSESDPRYSHFRANVIGEMYEYLIYEKLLRWARETEEVNEFIIKGPHINRNSTIKDRFLYDPNNQIYYMSGGETISEFDALFRYGEHRYFVEITQTENKPLIRALKHAILRKYNLMRILFPRDEIGCWVITTYQGQISARQVSDLKVLRTPKYELDPDSFRVTGEAPSLGLPRMKKLRSVYDLQYEPFQLFQTLFRIHNQLRKLQPQEIRKAIRGLVQPYAGIIERCYIGKTSADEFHRFLEDNGYLPIENIQIRDAYLAIKVDNNLSMKKAFYLKGIDNKYFELTDIKSMKLKKIDRSKRSHREIRRLDKSLKKLDSQELKLYWTAI